MQHSDVKQYVYFEIDDHQFRISVEEMADKGDDWARLHTEYLDCFQTFSIESVLDAYARFLTEKPAEPEGDDRPIYGPDLLEDNFDG